MSHIGISQRGHSTLGLILLGAFLAAGVVCSSSIVAAALKEIKLAGQTMTVKGYAEKKITSDLGIWRGSFAQINVNLANGYSALKLDLEKVLTYLEKQGVKRSDVEISAVETSTLYKQTDEGTMTNQIEGYRLSQTVAMRSGDIALVDRLSRESTDLIQQNIGFQSSPPEYYFTKIDDLKIEMLGEAARDAKERAVKLAESTGNRVGALRSAQQGVFQITPENSTSVSDYGENDTSSIRKSIKAVVTMQFSIQ